MRCCLALAILAVLMGSRAAAVAEEAKPEWRPAIVIAVAGDDTIGRTLREMKVLETGAAVPQVHYKIYSREEWEFFGEPMTDRPVCILEMQSANHDGIGARKVAICPLRKIFPNKVGAAIAYNSEKGLILRTTTKVNETDYILTGDITKHYRLGKDYVLISNHPSMLEITPEQVRAYQQSIAENTLFSFELNVAETPASYWNQYPPLRLDLGIFPKLSLHDLPRQLESIHFEISRDPQLQKLRLRGRVTLLKSSALSPFLEPFVGARSKYESLVGEHADLNYRVRAHLSKQHQEFLTQVVQEATADICEPLGNHFSVELHKSLQLGLEMTFLTGRLDFAGTWSSRPLLPEQGAFMIYSVGAEAMAKLSKAEESDTAAEARVASFLTELPSEEDVSVFKVTDHQYLAFPENTVIYATEEAVLNQALKTAKNPYATETAQAPLMISGRIGWLAPTVLPFVPAGPVKTWLEKNQTGDARYQVEIQATERVLQLDITIDDRSLTEVLRSELGFLNNLLIRQPEGNK